MNDLTGTDFADAFEARVVQNSLGAQVNQLGSGDQIDGGAGTDTLMAKVTAGAFINGLYSFESMPIQPEISNVEVVKLEAVETSIGNEYFFNGYGFDNTQVYVNAKDMTDVEQLWSSRSDADLIIQNLTTVGLDQLSDMTIGMEYTGNADSRWGESDYTVYFDQDYLTPAATRTNSSVDFLAMNEDNYDVSGGTSPLEGVFFRELQFTLNGEVFVLANSVTGVNLLGGNPLGAGDEIVTYEDFLEAMQEALIALKAANAGNAALQGAPCAIAFCGAVGVVAVATLAGVQLCGAQSEDEAALRICVL